MKLPGSVLPSRVAMPAWGWRAFARLLVAAGLAVSACLPAHADDDLPGRVGRIAEFAGELFLSPEDRATEWEAVGLNYPVISGDNLWVSGAGRAEIDYGGGQFRLAGDTNLHVSRLDDRQLALFVAQGRIIVRVRVLDPGDATRVDTPNTQVTLTRPGLYRIDVAPDRQQTTVTVREGEALVALANGAQQALPGQVASVFGPDPAYADVRNNVGTDGFDAWSASRDRHYDQARSSAYVSRQMVGYADLDAWGAWQTYPEYGAVWFPTTVAPGWAPYRDGYWANVGGWGYTWVDSAPWGYAPFHYGRWAWIDGRWGWCPGAYVARPVWAPAMVGWVGGAGWGLSLNAGGPVYGWVPLGWGEAYVPWWKRCSYNCWTHYNRPYRVNVATRPSAPPPRYNYAGVPGAITAVPAAAITGRRPIPTNMVQVPASLATSAPVMATAPTVAPGPAPGPRVRPGAGTTTGSTAPPPASTFVPPRRGGVAGEGEGSRPQTGARPLPPTAVTPSTPAQALTPAPTPPAARPGVTPTPTTVTPPTGQPAATPPAQPASTPSAPRPSATPPIPPATAPTAPPFGATPPASPATGGIGGGSPPQDGARWPAQSRRPPVFSAPPTVTSPPTGVPPTTGAPAHGAGGALPPPEPQPRGQQRGPREPQPVPPQTAPAPAAPAPAAPAPVAPAVRAVPPTVPPQSTLPAPMSPPTRAVQPPVPQQSATPAPMSPPTRAVQPSPPQGSGPLPAPPSRPAPPPVPVQGGGQGGAAAPAAPGPGVAPAPHGGGQGGRGGGGGEKGGEKGSKSGDDKPAANPTSGGGGPPK